MVDQDYEKVLGEAMAKIAELATTRDAIDIELAKLRQFIFATLNMLPDEKRKFYERTFAESQKFVESRYASLTEAIKKVLQEFPNQYHTASQVRDRLVNQGFDFTYYTSNPLASVYTTLKRMKAEEVETSEIEGVAAFRWKLRPIVVVHSRRRRRHSENWERLSSTLAVPSQTDKK